MASYLINGVPGIAHRSYLERGVVAAGDTFRAVLAEEKTSVDIAAPATFVTLERNDGTLCGPICLRYVLLRAGRHVELSEILSATPHSTAGTSYLELAFSAAALGMTARLLRLEPDWIAGLLAVTGLPVIVAVRPAHFICITGIEQRQIVAFDPNRGHIDFPAEQLPDMWDGRALAFDHCVVAVKTEEEERCE